jgi:type II secretory pathway pseudopilin PulG
MTMTTEQNDSYDEEIFDDDASVGAGSDDHLDMSSTNRDNGNTNSASSTEDSPSNNLAKDETAAVFRLRVIVIIVLMITAAVVSAVVLGSAQSGEMDEFQTQFSGAAHMVQSAFGDVSDKLSVVSALAVVSDGEEEDKLVDELRGANWPFITLQNFKERAANARYLSGALSISLCPLVNVENREQWELYVNGPESAWM